MTNKEQKETLIMPLDMKITASQLPTTSHNAQHKDTSSSSQPRQSFMSIVYHCQTNISDYHWMNVFMGDLYQHMVIQKMITNSQVLICFKIWMLTSLIKTQQLHM